MVFPPNVAHFPEIRINETSSYLIESRDPREELSEDKSREHKSRIVRLFENVLDVASLSPVPCKHCYTNLFSKSGTSVRGFRSTIE